MTWITEARNSGDMEAPARVPDVCMDVKVALVLMKTLDVGAVDTASKELSELFGFVEVA